MSKMKLNEFIMFMDDDVVLFNDTFKKMNACIQKYGDDKNIAGFGFNQIEKEKVTILEKLKSFKILKYLNIYPLSPGKVARSGWQSKILNLNPELIKRLAIGLPIVPSPMKAIFGIYSSRLYGELFFSLFGKPP